MKQCVKKNQSKLSTGPFSKKQAGAALFVSLIILMVLTVLGLSAARRSTLQERMGSNLHIQNLAFNAAESAIGGFVVDSHTGNKLDPNHVLSKVRLAGTLSGICYNQEGKRVTCGSAKLDGDHGGATTSEITVKMTQACSPRACGGFSLGGSGTDMGCRVYQLDATGTVGTQTESSQLIAFEVTACTE